MRARLALLLLVGALGACNNPCQDLCQRMADFAADCGYNVPEAEIDACVERQSSVEREDKAACRDFGDPEVIDGQWTCDDLAAYWEGEG